MAEILLVNPRRRRRKMSAKQARYFGKRRRRRTTRATSRRRRRRSNPSHLLAMNPRRRRRRRHSVRALRRRRRSNPGGLSIRGITGQIMPTVRAGFTGALGALGLDVLMGFAAPKLPVAVQTGFAKDAIKVIGAVLVGILGGMVLKGKGRELAVGAVTVSLHDLLKAQLASMLPQIPLGEYGYMNPGTPIGAYLEDNSGGVSGYGAYIEDEPVGVGQLDEDDF